MSTSFNRKAGINRRALMVLGPAALLGFSTIASSAEVQDNALTEEAKLILAKCGKLKKGSKRKDVLQDFRLDGGITPVGTQRFHYKKCPFIKIDVSFGGSKEKLNDEDTVESVSAPYFQEPVLD